VHNWIVADCWRSFELLELDHTTGSEWCIALYEDILCVWERKSDTTVLRYSSVGLKCWIADTC